MEKYIFNYIYKAVVVVVIYLSVCLFLNWDTSRASPVHPICLQNSLNGRKELFCHLRWTTWTGRIKQKCQKAVYNVPGHEFPEVIVSISKEHGM